MFLIIIIIIISILLCVILGPYSVEIKGRYSSRNNQVGARILSIMGFYGLEFYFDKGVPALSPVLFRKRKTIQKGLLKSSTKKKEKKKPKNEKKESSKKRKLSFCLVQKFGRKGLSLLTGILSVFKIQTVKAQGILGLSDPALTGQIWGAYHSLQYVYPHLTGCILVPCFEESRIEFSGRIVIHFVLIHLLFQIAIQGIRAFWLLSVCRNK
jgi:hypothetical protein